MPYKREYKMGAIKKGGSKTPSSVMGSQGTSANIPTSHFKNKPTKHTKFPG